MVNCIIWKDNLASFAGEVFYQFKSEGLHGKHEIASQHSLENRRKQAACVDMVGRTLFRMHTDSSQQPGQQESIAVP
jgi:hypothetical protein